MAREKKDIRPELVKFGVAVALSLGGIMYSIIRAKRNKRSQTPPSRQSPERELSGTRSDHHAPKVTPRASIFDPIGADEHEESCLPRVKVNYSIADHSSSSKSDGNKDGFLLPEFNDLVKDFDLAAMKANISPKKDLEQLISDTESPKEHSRFERDAQDQEIKSLRNLVRILKERERTLEIQLLEYYGLKEQETAVMELQNRLKINSMEAKLFTLKIDSLQADNRRLESQVADYAKVVAELEAARAKVKMLKKKLRFDAEQNREQLVALQQRVQKMQAEERIAVASDPEIQLKLHKLKDLEVEAEDLRKTNHNLQLEKSDFAQRLESLQIIANSVLEDEKTDRLKEESISLRKQNEDLAKEIEQLKADRCSDAEELVYIRWINACLRYELRNYQPGTGKTIARDLSKSLSPKSEERAKQLILEYAHKEGTGDKGINITEFDSDEWSSSQASGEYEDSFGGTPPSHKHKTKFFGKLMKLLRGKDGHRHSRGSPLERSISGGDVIGTSFSESPFGTDGQSNRSTTLSQSSSRRSLDIQRALGVQAQRHSDVGSMCVYKRIDAIAEGAPDSRPSDVGNSELLKYAEALDDTRRKSPNFPRRTASFSSF